MMADHVKEHIDTNKDGMIHISEFIEYTKREDFSHADPWQAVFSGSEYDFDDSTVSEKVIFAIKVVLCKGYRNCELINRLHGRSTSNLSPYSVEKN